MKKVFILLMAAMLLLTACSSNNQNSQASTDNSSNTETSAETSVETSAETAKEESGSTETSSEESSSTETSGETETAESTIYTLDDYVGTYGAGRPSMVIARGEDGNAMVEIFWSTSAAQHTEWTMSGSFDPQTLTISYENGVKTVIAYEADGTTETKTVEYEDGTGRIVFAGDGTATWEDDKEDAGAELVFTNQAPQNAEAEDEDADYYNGVTTLSKDEVEAFALLVKEAYLAEDWDTIGNLIAYPITMYPEEEITDKQAFLDYMSDKTLTEADAQKMQEETCTNMFTNGEGICMGSGQIWIRDVNFMNADFGKLAVIAVSGFDEK